MTVQANFLGRNWEVSSRRIASIGSLSTAVEVKRVSDSTQGKSKITGLELQELNLEYLTTYEAGGDPRAEFEAWDALVGKYGPLRIGSQRFGAPYFQLRSVSMNDALVDSRGRIRKAVIALHLVEYVAPETKNTGNFQVFYKGKDIYPDISVKSCELDMHAESQADSLVLRFNDPKHLWDSWSPEQESTIEVMEGAARSGKMFIYDLKPENGTYTLKAFSIPPTSKNRTSKSWEKVHFKQLCKEIAGRHGLNYEEHGVTDQVYDYVVQNNLPDFVFLEQRCKLEGCSFLVFNGKLVIYGEQKLEGMSPQKLLKLNTDAKFTYEDNTAKSYKAGEVVNGTRTGYYEAESEAGSRILHKNINIQMASSAEANRFAKNLLRLENKNQKTGVIEWDIQREIAPGSMIQLKTIGAKSWDGYAFVKRVRHDFLKEKSKIFIRKPLKY